MAKDVFRASSTACVPALQSRGQVKILDLGDALHIFQHLGDKPLVGNELPLGKGLLRPLHGGVDGEEQQKSRQRNKPIRQSKRNIITAMMPEVRNPLVVTMTTRVAMLDMFSMVFVVTEVTSPRLLSLNQPIGRYRRYSAISIRLLAQAR